MFSDSEAAVGLNLSYWIADISKARHFLKEGIIATTTLSATLDDVPRSKGSS